MEVNGARAKPHRELRVDDRVTVTMPGGRRRELVVRGLADRSIPKAQARGLYQEVTPPEAPEVLEARRLDRMIAPSSTEGKPDRRERRARRERKGW